MTNEFKTIVNIPGWVENFGNQDKLSGGAGAYKRVPLVFRCTRLIADSLASVELKVYEGRGKEKKEVDWPFEIDTVDWTYKTISSVLLMGMSISIALKGVLNRELGMEWIDPTTVTPELDRQTKKLYFKKTVNADGGKDRWEEDEVIYIRELNLGNGVKPGASAASVALGDAELTNYLTKFASYYFQQGAMPLTIIPLPTSTTDVEVKRVERMWKSMTSGIKRAFTIMGLRVGKDGGQPYTLTSPLKDLVMPQLSDRARKHVADAFGIPITMLDDAANYATASEHNSQFWKTCVRPHGVKICAVLNKYLKKRFGIYAEYAFEELDEFQEDEANRASSVKLLVDAGAPVLTAMDVLGYDLTKDQRKEIQDEVERRRQVQERFAEAEAGGKNPPNPPSEATPQGGQTSPTNPPSEEDLDGGKSSVRSALFNWKAAALKAIRTGHDLAELDFDHPAIPEDAAKMIRAGLKTCRSADDVHEIFKKARGWCARQIESPQPPFASQGGQSGEELFAELKRANDLLEMEMMKG